MQYLCAGVAKLPNKGEGVVEFKTEDGQQRSMVFQNAEVGMPIMSTHGVACDWDSEVTYGADKGHVTLLADGKRVQFIMRDGVYFIEMRVPKSAVQPPPEPHPSNRARKDFPRHA